MVRTLYKDDAEKQAALANFKNLELSGGWMECVKVLDYNIEYLLERIVSGDFVDLKELNVIRTKIVDLRDLRRLPETQINKLTNIDHDTRSYDPYDYPEKAKEKKV